MAKNYLVVAFSLLLFKLLQTPIFSKKDFDTAKSSYYGTFRHCIEVFTAL